MGNNRRGRFARQRGTATRDNAAPLIEIDVLSDQGEFESLVDRLALQPAVALDTEFHREGTYFPRLALLQMASADELVLVDPLKVEIRGLRRLLEADVEIVMHAGRQDLEILDLYCGAVPKRTIDTQLAAAFLGYSSPSLATLMDRELGVELAKDDRLTDWMRRPLSPSQLSYAAADVASLLQLWKVLGDQLDACGRRPWAMEAFEDLCSDAIRPRDPEMAWTKVRDLRKLRGRALAAGQVLAAWRERTASQVDVPVRAVLSDMGVISLAQSRPGTVASVRAARGVEPRNLKGELAERVVEVLKDAPDTPRLAPVGTGVEVPSDLKPVVALLTAWVSQLSRDLQVDTAMLATRSDIEAFLAGADGARLNTGWRHDVVGDPARRLVDGLAAVAFDADKGLMLLDRPSGNTDGGEVVG